jgi:hypothetical protein
MRAVTVVMLGLLISPVSAARLSNDDCFLLNEALDDCRAGPNAYDGTCPYLSTRSMAGNVVPILQRHPEIKLRPLCEKVCHGEMTRQEAMKQVCPKWIEH